MLLKLIVLKKLLMAGLLFILSLFAFVSSRHYHQLPELSQKLSSGDHLVLAHLARRAMTVHQDVLVVVAIVFGFYAVLLTAAAWASWHRKRWGDQVLFWIFVFELVVEIWQFFKSFAWHHLVAIAIAALGARLIWIHLQRIAELQIRSDL